ncbi:MAG: carbon-nitrogen hydrolase family protein [Polyangiaceae bacterium]
MFLAACVQLCCTTDVERNLAMTEQLVRRAATRGASLVATPENTAFLGPQFHKVEQAQSLDGPIAQRLARLASELGIHLLVGAIAERKVDESGTIDTSRCYNTSVMFGPAGERLASYRKMHLFDVDVPGGLTIRESDSIAPGDELVVADTALGKMGLSICYDLRFPELYRALVDRGAEMIAVPSAFTLTTGKDHWHALLRARAIETQTWVLAPAQWGTHDEQGKRKSYGHSVIIDPWGAIVADKGHGEGLCFAEIDLDRVAAARRAIPVGQHRRLSSGYSGGSRRTP